MLDLKTLYLKATHPYPTIRKNLRPQFVLECRTLGPDRILRVRNFLMIYYNLN
uniref:Uncharacterized protein n=1 Tax=Meloidogyne enterolobii TaxID=390850 RepID=A0A6V7XHI9_MELEN|nr:unnamed protein product [Meloidogyne enterolobii]